MISKIEKLKIKNETKNLNKKWKKKIILKISLKENNKLQITYTNTLKEEKLIQFDVNRQEEYPVTISFDNNKITVCE